MLSNKLLSSALVQPSDWDIATASYTGKSFDFSDNLTSVSSLVFKPDGSSFYLQSGSEIYQYDMSVNWAIETATFQSSYTVSGSRMFFSADGARLYTSGNLPQSFDGVIYQYDLSPAWDLSSAVLSGSFEASNASSNSIYISPDGQYMFLSPYQSSYSRTRKYVLSAAWDISTAAYDSYIDVDPDRGFDYTTGVFFKPDGTRIINLLDSGGGVQNLGGLTQASLASAWELPDARVVPDEEKRLFEDQPPNSSSLSWQGIWIKPDGRRMFLAGDVTDTIYEYSIG